MNDWKNAIEKFLDTYKNEDYFIGAILTGSYATGNQNVNSDIDKMIQHGENEEVNLLMDI